MRLVSLKIIFKKILPGRFKVKRVQTHFGTNVCPQLSFVYANLKYVKVTMIVMIAP